MHNTLLIVTIFIGYAKIMEKLLFVNFFSKNYLPNTKFLISLKTELDMLIKRFYNCFLSYKKLE